MKNNAKIREMAVKLYAALLSFYLNTDPLYIKFVGYNLKG